MVILAHDHQDGGCLALDQFPVRIQVQLIDHHNIAAQVIIPQIIPFHAALGVEQFQVQPRRRNAAAHAVGHRFNVLAVGRHDAGHMAAVYRRIDLKGGDLRLTAGLFDMGGDQFCRLQFFLRTAVTGKTQFFYKCQRRIVFVLHGLSFPACRDIMPFVFSIIAHRAAYHKKKTDKKQRLHP